MNCLFRKYWYLAVAAVLLCAPASFAQVNMQLTAVNGTSAGGVYTDPYYGTINGVSSTIICDDYGDETYFNETWLANVTNETNAGTASPAVKWNAGSASATQTLYNELAWLATQLLAATPGQAQADYSFAIWQLACSSATATVGNNCSNPVNSLSAADQQIVQNEINAAKGQTYTPGEFSNVYIYTPISGSQGMCGNNPCVNTPPQEFIVVTPESSTVVMVGADLLGLLALAFFFRRRGLLALN